MEKWELTGFIWPFEGELRGGCFLLWVGFELRLEGS